MNTLTEQNSFVCRELAIFVYTAFHSNVVSKGFRKPDVCQALWWALEKSKKNLLHVFSPEPQPKGPPCCLSSSNAPSFRKSLRSAGWGELPSCPYVHRLCAWARFSVSLVYALPRCPGKLLLGLKYNFPPLHSSPHAVSVLSPVFRRTTLSYLPRPSCNTFSHSALIT